MNPNCELRIANCELATPTTRLHRAGDGIRNPQRVGGRESAIDNPPNWGHDS